MDNRLLLGALREAATLAGVRIRRGEAAIRLLSRAGRVTGVQLASEEVVHAAWVVLAGGAWSPELAGLPRRLPVEPVHGELLALRPAERPFRRVLDSPRIYLVPRADGRIIVGATVERIGFERRVTAGGVRRLLSASIELVPALSGAALVETWSGHRPGTPDGRPVLGPDPDLPNLLYATGHYRNGILLTPVTARLLAEVVLHEGAPAELEPFTVSRFAGS